MVLPRDELSVKLSHTGMRNGNMVIKVETMILFRKASNSHKPFFFYTFIVQQSLLLRVDLPNLNSPTSTLVGNEVKHHHLTN